MSGRVAMTTLPSAAGASSDDPAPASVPSTSDGTVEVAGYGRFDAAAAMERKLAHAVLQMQVEMASAVLRKSDDAARTAVDALKA